MRSDRAEERGNAGRLRRRGPWRRKRGREPDAPENRRKAQEMPEGFGPTFARERASSATGTPTDARELG